MINGHKELRFLFPLVNALPVVIGFVSDERDYSLRFKRLSHFLASKFTVVSAKVFLALNVGFALHYSYI